MKEIANDFVLDNDANRRFISGAVEGVYISWNIYPNYDLGGNAQTFRTVAILNILGVDGSRMFYFYQLENLRPGLKNFTFCFIRLV